MKTNTTNTKKKTDDNKITKAEYIIPIAAIVGVAFMWYLCYYLITKYYGIKQDGTIDWAIRGQVGDLFGAVNAMFSGLAFAGIIYTIYLQRLELKAQRKELALTRKEFKEQNDTLKRQRFEHTFFKLLDNHNQVVNNLSIKYEMPSVYDVTIYDVESEKGRDGFFRLIKLLENDDLFKQDIYADMIQLSQMKDKYHRILTAMNKQQIELYVQSLSTLLAFIAWTELLQDKDPEQESHDRGFYFSIVTSSQSLMEKEFVYYHIALGWKIIDKNDPTKNLQWIERDHSIYQGINNNYIKGNISHSLLMEKALESFFKKN